MAGGHIKQLHALDAEVEQQIGGPANKKLVTNQDAFGDNIDRYPPGVRRLDHPSLDTSAPTLGQGHRRPVAGSRRPRSRGFSLRPRRRPRTAETIGRGGRTQGRGGRGRAVRRLPVAPTGPDGDTYLEMLRHNTTTIVHHLSVA